MVHGRTDMPSGSLLGHEITGEVVAIGLDCVTTKVGDLVSVPFNVACGRCTNCKHGFTNACLVCNPDNPGAAYGYADQGGWPGGQAEYVLVPFADFNLLKIPNRDLAMTKIRDLAMITDIFPTAFHGAVSAGVCAGKTVYIAGAGPVGRACAASCSLLGAASVVVGDYNVERLNHLKQFGVLTVDLNQHDNDVPGAIDKLLGERYVDCSVECVGFEARGLGGQKDVPVAALANCINLTRAGGKIGVPGVYPMMDPRGVDKNAKMGTYSIPFGAAWLKGIQFCGMGQCPVMQYNRELMTAIMFDKIRISEWVNSNVISLDDAPKAYQTFDPIGEASADKFIIDPHATLDKGPIRVTASKFNKDHNVE